MLKPLDIPSEAKLDMVTEALLFLVRHSTVPNMADALIAELHRASAGDPVRTRVVDDLADRLRERDQRVAEDDA